jgi:AraC-like DNA-binding protein
MATKNICCFNTQDINISLNIESAYISTTDPIYRNPYIYHDEAPSKRSDFYSLVHTIENEGVIKTDRGNFTLKKNDIMFFYVRDVIEMASDNGPWHFHTIHFRPTNLKLPLYKVFNVPPLPQERERLEKLIQLVQSNDFLNCCLANTIAQSLIFEILAEIDDETDSSPYADAMQNIASHIHWHINENLSVKELASLCSFSENHFCNIFKQYFKVSPKAYIIKAKLQKAAFLLTSTSSSVTSISDELSFYSPAYFTSSFKKYYGKTPLQFRNEKQ